MIGLTSALALAEDGHTVTLLERAPGPAAESSGAAAGILSLLYPWDYPEPLQRLAAYSRRVYPGWCGGADVGWAAPGVLSFDIAGAPPGTLRAAGDAVWLPEVATLEPRLLAAALAARAAALGVRLRWGAAAAAIEVARSAVQGVRLTDGTRVAAGAVVVAAGAWSTALLAPLGVAVAVRPVRGQVIELQGPAGLFGTVLMRDRCYLLPRADGRIVVGSTVEEVGFDASTTAAAAALLRATAAALAPETAAMPIRAQWAGLRPGSPDGMPRIGPVPDYAGLWLNLGHFRNGITLAPGSAVLLAALVAGRAAPVEPSAFLPEPQGL